MSGWPGTEIALVTLDWDLLALLGLSQSALHEPLARMVIGTLLFYGDSHPSWVIQQVVLGGGVLHTTASGPCIGWFWALRCSTCAGQGLGSFVLSLLIWCQLYISIPSSIGI